MLPQCHLLLGAPVTGQRSLRHRWRGRRLVAAGHAAKTGAMHFEARLQASTAQRIYRMMLVHRCRRRWYRLRQRCFVIKRKHLIGRRPGVNWSQLEGVSGSVLAVIKIFRINHCGRGLPAAAARRRVIERALTPTDWQLVSTLNPGSHLYTKVPGYASNRRSYIIFTIRFEHNKVIHQDDISNRTSIAWAVRLGFRPALMPIGIRSDSRARICRTRA